MAIWTACIIIVVGVVLATLAFFVLPGLIVDEGLPPANRLKLENSVRTTAIQAVGGLVALTGAAATIVGAARTLAHEREVRITQRFTEALEGIADGQSNARRIGAAHALARIALDSERDRPAAVAVMLASLREHAPWDPLADSPQTGKTSPEVRSFARDIVSVLASTGRIEGLDLSGINFEGARLPRVALAAVDLRNTNLSGADLTGITLSSAQLQGCYCIGTNFSDATLGSEAQERAAVLRYARLEAASFRRADLRNCDFSGSTIDPGTDFGGADLRGAIGLPAQFRHDDETKLPEQA